MKRLLHDQNTCLRIRWLRAEESNIWQYSFWQSALRSLYALWVFHVRLSEHVASYWWETWPRYFCCQWACSWLLVFLCLRQTTRVWNAPLSWRSSLHWCIERFRTTAEQRFSVNTAVAIYGYIVGGGELKDKSVQTEFSVWSQIC